MKPNNIHQIKVNKGQELITKLYDKFGSTDYLKTLTWEKVNLNDTAYEAKIDQNVSLRIAMQNVQQQPNQIITVLALILIYKNKSMLPIVSKNSVQDKGDIVFESLKSLYEAISEKHQDEIMEYVDKIKI